MSLLKSTSPSSIPGKISVFFYLLRKPAKLLVLAPLLAVLFFPAATVSAQNCAKLMGSGANQSWKSIPCEKLKQSYMLPIRELPELGKLTGLPLEEAAEVLGLPFHVYNHEKQTICFFRPEAFVSIAYNEKTEMPDLISFDFVGVINADEIPQRLGIKILFPPQVTEESLVWEDLSPYSKIEIKYPDLRVDGENVYEVRLHLPPAAPPAKKDKDDGRPGRNSRRR